jgi:DNA-binding transcriptional MocR family regulator
VTTIATAPTPLAARGLHTMVIDTLGLSIVAGDYKPGDRIMPDALGGSYGISRTVMREAVRVLQDKGLISARPNVGTLIRPVEEWHLLDADVLRWRAAAGLDEPLDTDIRHFTEQLLVLSPVLGDNLLYRQLLATLTGLQPETDGEPDEDTEAGDTTTATSSPVSEWIPSMVGPDGQGAFVATTLEAALPTAATAQPLPEAAA